MAVVAAAGCAGHRSAVAVTVPSPTDGTACGRLIAALPHSLEGRSRRTTVPASSLVVAWGSPAVILRCGVPAVVTASGDHIVADGVSWVTPGAVKGLVVWTTTDRTTSVELSVPDSINDQENILGDLALALTGSVSQVPAPASATASPGAPAPSG